jgi:hypothetical protein
MAEVGAPMGVGDSCEQAETMMAARAARLADFPAGPDLGVRIAASHIALWAKNIAVAFSKPLATVPRSAWMASARKACPWAQAY